ncbi:FmdB family zinc ribbon protein [Motilibacter rhizosphaerae]|uniref:FmdB family zinc ribbon protein n=1 Tax=Motilibacter rhizosphaerae TaxID=598652 RepID=UPI0013EE9678|nr:FmdB family zinc ribbon protein [Motilibacter rhizosphaerae]
MPTYAYSCSSCGLFDVVRPMSGVAAEERCPGCTSLAARVFSVPALRRTSAGLARALTTAESSADAPAVARRAPRPESASPTPVRAAPGKPALPRP